VHRLESPAGVTISYDKYGSGPPLLLVHGSFSDHRTNWELVKEELGQRYTVHALARRGRGETDATEGHSMEDEFSDLAALITSIEEPVFLLGHSYGAHVALGAALMMPDRVRKLVVYEPPNPRNLDKDVLRRLEKLASISNWDEFAETFFRDMLHVPAEVLEEMRKPEIWSPILSDASASLGDLRAIGRYAFNADHFRALKMPVLLQVGTESPREQYVTDALAAVLPDARIEELPGQAHEAPTTGPAMYAESVSRFLG
jgi:pimeloyl-ACP methyl ester carboxylesterase